MAEVPLLQQLYWKYQASGLKWLGVSLDEDPKAARRVIAEKSIPWPEICDGQAEKGEVAKLYNVEGTPDLWVIDRAGNIAVRLISAKTLDQALFEVASTDPIPPRTERDGWQRPVRIMEELGIREGSAVADIGAGGGYFTFRLAARVGTKGKVYAEDLDAKGLAAIRDRSEREKLTQIETIQGSADDPKLGDRRLDAALVVDAFHEFTNVEAMVDAIARTLKPGGRLGIIDRTAKLGLKPAEYMERHVLPQETVVAQAARGGLRLLSFDSTFASPPDETPYYFAVFEKPR
jgi:predicted methyltransferase